MTSPVTLILGLGRDVGPACARRFAEAGHRVLVADPNEDKLNKTQEALGETGIYHLGDLHSRLGLKNCFAAASEGHGRLDNLVIIPPLPEPATLAGLEMAALDKALKNSVRASALTLSLFHAAILDQAEDDVASIDRKRQRATVTFILGVSARFAEPGRYMEALTQSAMLGLVRASAVELAADGIRCNAISAVRPRAENVEPWLKARTPLKRAALADEIAESAFFLASPNAAIITGETLILDGGRSRLGGILGPIHSEG